MPCWRAGWTNHWTSMSWTFTTAKLFAGPSKSSFSRNLDFIDSYKRFLSFWHETMVSSRAAHQRSASARRRRSYFPPNSGGHPKSIKISLFSVLVFASQITPFWAPKSTRNLIKSPPETHSAFGPWPDPHFNRFWLILTLPGPQKPLFCLCKTINLWKFTFSFQDLSLDRFSLIFSQFWTPKCTIFATKFRSKND